MAAVQNVAAFQAMAVGCFHAAKEMQMRMAWGRPSGRAVAFPQPPQMRRGQRAESGCDRLKLSPELSWRCRANLYCAIISQCAEAIEMPLGARFLCKCRHLI
jgi:hypothetical protein